MHKCLYISIHISKQNNDTVSKRTDDGFYGKVNQLKYVMLPLFLEQPLLENVITANPNTERVGSEAAQSLSSESVPCGYAVVETATPRRHC